MNIIISVWQDEKLYCAAFVKGRTELIFATHREREPILERAANVAIEFDIDLHVMGHLADPHEVRDTYNE